MRPLLLLTLVTSGLVLVAMTPMVTSGQECRVTDVQCEFWLHVTHRLTMMRGSDAVYPYQGRLYAYYVPEAQANATNNVDVDDVVVADAWETPRLVVVANGSMPGPAIQVYEGQTVVVHVTNRLTTQGVAIHWHGMHQRGTPWMDGVAFLTQCPIEPGQSFTYRFTALPRGTFWYHSHLGSQRAMGLLGPLIVKQRCQLPQPAPRLLDSTDICHLPQLEEHIMVLQDWNHDWDADLFLMRMKLGSFKNRRPIPFATSLDGAKFGIFLFQSGLINGKGRYFDESGRSNMAPLTEYDVEQGKRYRFRVIGAGSTYPFRVSVDGHPITLIASDGNDLDPLEVESVVVHPGERFDFVLHAKRAVTSYWVRAVSLEVNVVNHIALAILKYRGSSGAEPTTRRKACRHGDRCLVANCPFLFYPQGSHTDCVNFDLIKAKEKQSPPCASDDGFDQEEEVQDMFFNFAFPGAQPTSAVNGVSFLSPPSPVLTQPQDLSTLCSPKDGCGVENMCQCTHSVTLETGKLYQLVLLSKGRGKGFSHPVHLHGHTFTVVKMAFPQYNLTTGAIVADNPDISCYGNPDNPDASDCNQVTWTDRSWGGNQVPGLELDRPPRKDTVLVPTGGYTVVRVRADNPGVWLMHCHMDLHLNTGMAVMFNESFALHPPPPWGFPECGNFDFRYPSPSLDEWEFPDSL